MRDSFAPIEAVLTRLAHKASKEVPTKSGAKWRAKAVLNPMNIASKVA